jgi:hypothetical protein
MNRILDPLRIHALVLQGHLVLFVVVRRKPLSDPPHEYRNSVPGEVGPSMPKDLLQRLLMISIIGGLLE